MLALSFRALARHELLAVRPVAPSMNPGKPARLLRLEDRERMILRSEAELGEVRSQTELGNEVNEISMRAAMRIVRLLTGQLTKSRGNAKH
jgi:hypothetical protein